MGSSTSGDRSSESSALPLQGNSSNALTDENIKEKYYIRFTKKKDLLIQITHQNANKNDATINEIQINISELLTTKCKKRNHAATHWVVDIFEEPSESANLLTGYIFEGIKAIYVLIEMVTEHYLATVITIQLFSIMDVLLQKDATVPKAELMGAEKVKCAGVNVSVWLSVVGCGRSLLSVGSCTNGTDNIKQMVTGVTHTCSG